MSRARRRPPELVERFELARIRPNPRNPRTVTPEGERHLADSLRRFGMVEVLVVNRAGWGLVSGHLRLKALQAEGRTHAGVMVVDLSPRDEKALSLRLNGHAGRFDADALAGMLRELAAEGEDLSAIGIDGEAGFTDAIELLDGTAATVEDPDDAPPLPKVAVSKAGEIYQLGPHRLACGDSTDPALVREVLAEAQPACVWTDPPYGVSYSSKAGKVENDDLAEPQLIELLRRALGLAHQHCRPGAAWYVASPGGPLFHAFGIVLRDLEVWRETILWVKDSLVLSRQDYHWRHEVVFAGGKECEPITYGWKDGRHFWRGGRKQDTVWEIPRPKRSEDHPTMKPVALVQRCLLNSTRAGDPVYDPFGGSGTTLAACAISGRKAHLVELSPAYCDVIRRRWSRLATEMRQDPGPGGLA